MFFVQSAEVVPCPCCNKGLDVVGSRKRIWFKRNGERAKLVIRRLNCERCRRIHHELPDLLVPYKRYDAESIEAALSESNYGDTAAEESTLSRWRAWFAVFAIHAVACLQSLALRFGKPVPNTAATSHSTLLALQQYIGDAPKWLSRVVCPIVNDNRWSTDPFCVSIR